MKPKDFKPSPIAVLSAGFTSSDAVDRDAGTHALQLVISALMMNDPRAVAACADDLDALIEQFEALQFWAAWAANQAADARAVGRPLKGPSPSIALLLVLALSDLMAEASAKVRAAQRIERMKKGESYESN